MDEPNDISQITSDLFVGGLNVARNTDLLLSNGITTIVTVDTRPLKPSYIQVKNYKHFKAFDMPSFNILQHFDDFKEYLNYLYNSEDKGNLKIYIHCLAGKSRSVTFMIVALCHLGYAKDVKSALSMVKAVRPIAEPNTGFMHQLHLYEMCDYQVDLKHPLVKKLVWREVALHAKEKDLDSKNHAMETQFDEALQKLHGHEVYEDSTEYFRCSKCGEHLFDKHQLIPHVPGVSQRLPKTRKNMATHGLNTISPHEDVLADDEVEIQPNSSSTNVPVCSKGIFSEPTEWMRSLVCDNIIGKLYCPKCKQKVGSYNWSGEACACHRWITPAFHWDNTKVVLRQKLVFGS